MSDVTWTVEKLIRTAQAFDREARRNREQNNGERYDRNRYLAFSARRWARKKQQ